MVSTSVRPYRGLSADERRAARRARLKEACLDLIGEAGIASVSAEAVSARAALTKRYFYESFTDRDALLLELLDDLFTDVLAKIRDKLTDGGQSAPRRAHAVVTALMEFMQTDHRRARLYVEAPGSPVLARRRDAAFETYSQVLLDTFPGYPIRAGDHEVNQNRRALAALIIVAGTTQAVVSWLQGEVDLSRDELIEELASVIRSVLVGDGGPGISRSAYRSS
jgi:AcrR family transcriptional regulator